MSAHPDALALSLYADGELPVEQLPALAAHLADCAACRAEVDDIRAFSAQLKAAVARPMPERFAMDPAAVAALVADHPQGTAAPRGRLLQPAPGRWRLPLIICAVAAVLLVVALGTLCGGTRGLAACTGAGGGLGRSIAALGGPTPVPRQGAGAATPTAVATRSAVTPTAGELGASYPGPTITSSLPPDIGFTATALALAAEATRTPAAYPAPATGTTQPPAPLRLTRAAVMAGLGTDGVDGPAGQLWLPWLGR